MSAAYCQKPEAQSPKPRAESGVALILVLMVMMTLSALAMSLALLTSTETRVTASYRDGMEALFGADAALQRVLPDLALEADFNGALSGAAVSSFSDGPPGLRRLPDGTFTDLRALTAMVNCGRAVCHETDLDESREDRPWGPNNPRWQLYGYGRLPADARVYAVVWIADDPSETDLDPLIDGGGDADNPGRGRLSVMAHAYGLGGTRRVIEATVARDAGELALLSWREIR
jgi:hypothetical protein